MGRQVRESKYCKRGCVGTSKAVSKVLGKGVYIFRLRKGCKDHIIFESENGTLIYSILARVYVVDIIIVAVWILS